MCHTHHTHHKAFDSNTRFLVCVTVMIHNPADGFCAERASEAASRRRERRLRSWLRHERMTVRMELAAALHHSAGPVPNDAVRSQKTVAPGVHGYRVSMRSPSRHRWTQSCPTGLRVVPRRRPCRSLRPTTPSTPWPSLSSAAS